MTLEAGRAYPLRVELENGTSGALRMQLHWKTPEIFAREKTQEARPRTRPVDLPAGTSWTDFWTGASHAGGRTIVAGAPIETLPLLVRAGSIVPLGPELQYATEKPADPIELRVYPGVDAVSRTFAVHSPCDVRLVGGESWQASGCRGVERRLRLVASDSHGAPTDEARDIRGRAERPREQGGRDPGR